MTAEPSNHVILLVEDDPAQVRTLRATLQTFGYAKVLASHTGEEALAQASAHKPDLALVDIGLRGTLDGVQVAEHLCALGVRVIYVTGSPADEQLSRAMLTRPAGYLLKPVRSAELRAAVEIALRMPRSASQATPSEPQPLAPPLHLLSPREVEVLRLVAMGHTGKEIALMLGIAKPTVDTYRVRIAEKLQANGRAELIAIATRAGLLLDPSRS